MKRKLKTLEEVFELVPQGEGVSTVRVTPSLDVQLDKWRLEQEADRRPVVTISYTLHTTVEPGHENAYLVNSMAIVYSYAEDVWSYGSVGPCNPVEVDMYSQVYSTLCKHISGRSLFLCPSPLVYLVPHADVEITADNPTELEPGSVGADMYDVVVADRVISRVGNPQTVLDIAKSALLPGGRFLVIENGYVARSYNMGFSLDGLVKLLGDFKVEQTGCVGNAVTVVHKISGADGWMPLQLTRQTPDPDCPSYVWALVTNG